MQQPQKIWYDTCSISHEKGTEIPFDDEHEYINTKQLIEKLEGKHMDMLDSDGDTIPFHEGYNNAIDEIINKLKGG